MIVDIHTHIFPPRFIRDRDRLADHDPQFHAMYADEQALMASAEDLLDSMREAGVDVSVACGFWWSDPEVAAEHAAYLVEVGARSDGAILPFVPTFTPPSGAAGIGEVRVEDAARYPEVDLPLLVHCSEEVGHPYAGKAGGLTPGGLWRLLEAHPHAKVIGAHWGGGFPFYALMPEVAQLLEEGRLLLDTAATRYLYTRDVFAAGVDLVGARAIAWGSDYPLRSQLVDLGEARDAIPTDGARRLILGANAARFLGLDAGEDAKG